MYNMKKFSSILLLLLLSLLGVTAQAQITDVSQITNGKTYTIKSVDRGFIFYDAATSTDYLRSSSINNTTGNYSGQFIPPLDVDLFTQPPAPSPQV